MDFEKKELFDLACEFRRAIEAARDAGEFKPAKPNQYEPMRNFPHDCCDDAADLFTHYLYEQFDVEVSMRVDGKYYDNIRHFTCGHSWQVVSGWIVDITGDQFDGDDALRYKAAPVYVGKMDDFHEQFEIIREEPSCGIESLGSASRDRMYSLYEKILKYLK